MTRNQAVEILRNHKEEIQARYGVTRLGLFGSLARDEARPDSDIDVVVEMQPNLFARVSLKAELESLFETDDDVIRYRSRMNPYLKQRIDQEALYV